MSCAVPAEGPIDDRASEYARGVVVGDVVAGPHVRAACQRHLDDIEHGHERGLIWDVAAADWAIGFYRHVLRLNGGEFEGKPYELLPWQAFIVGALFGWKGQDGFRRFRVAYIETAKGSGKSPLAAGLGLFCLVADEEPRAEIYAAATKKDQAQVLFRDAVAMVDQSPDLSSRIDKSGAAGREWNLAYQQTGSFFRPISSDDGQSGPRPHVGLLDEIHEHRTAYMVEMLRAGTKWRRQALIVMITNSGTDKSSVCWDYHEYAIKVAAGQVQDDSLFGYVCALDEGDDPFADEACWPKTNPSLPYGLPGEKYLREQVTQARGLPAKESVVRRLNFNQWVQADSPLLSADVWLSAKASPPDLHGRRCWGGLDLSSTQDLTSLQLVFEPTAEDQVWRLKSFFWLPGDELQRRGERDRVPYVAWRDAGHVETTPGKAINKRLVLARIAELKGEYDLQTVAYDRWRIEDLLMQADEDGIDLDLVPFGQGFKDMSPALDEFERRLLNDEMKHDGNPAMTWCASNAVADTDPAGNRKLTKRRATGRIDGVVAAVMAVGASIAAPQNRASVYEERGIRSL